MIWYMLVLSTTLDLLMAVLAALSGLFAVGFPVIVIWQDIHLVQKMQKKETTGKIYVETYILTTAICLPLLLFALSHFKII